jgi:acetylornithine deacetylase/succinyl-diaminopimelate desuccinylase-like protein
VEDARAFSGDLSEGYIYGRGTLDKSSVVAGLATLLERSGRNRADRDVIFLAEAGEEGTAGRDGIHGRRRFSISTPGIARGGWRRHRRSGKVTYAGADDGETWAHTWCCARTAAHASVPLHRTRSSTSAPR